MIFLTHLSFALLIGLILLRNITLPIGEHVFLGLLLFASILPDIDSVDSFIGKKTKLISMFLTHRSFFHSIAAVILFTVVVFIITANNYLALAFAIGYLSHLFLDSLTISGVPWTWPSKNRICGVLRTGRIWDWALLIVFFGLAFLMK